MAEISGIAVAERRAAITACYRRADSAEAFINALEEAGYILARGDKRCFVVVDIAGHVHSLARQIEGARMRDVRAKLEGLDPSRLPPVERAKVQTAQRAQAQQDVARITIKRQAEAKEAAEKLRTVQRKRRATLDLLWQKMKIRQMHEWKVLLAHIKGEEDRHLRRHWSQIGLARYLHKIAVIRQLLAYYAERRKKSLEEYHQQLKESLRRRHENEARELRRRYEALLRLERREWSAPIFVSTSTSRHGTAWFDGVEVTYTLGHNDPVWTGGAYVMHAERFEEGEPLPDQDPADYLQPAFAYELDIGASSHGDPAYGGGTFSETVHLSSDAVMADLFNTAAAGTEKARPAARAGEDEDERDGTHSTAPGSRGPGPPV